MYDYDQWAIQIPKGLSDKGFGMFVFSSLTRGIVLSFLQREWATFWRTR